MSDQPIRIDGAGSVTLNGVRLHLVALLAMSQPVDEQVAVTEDKIARRIARKIDKMKRKGYRAEYVAKLIGPWIQAEALAARAPRDSRACDHAGMEQAPCPDCGWAPPSDGPRAA